MNTPPVLEALIVGAGVDVALDPPPPPQPARTTTAKLSNRTATLFFISTDMFFPFFGIRLNVITEQSLRLPRWRQKVDSSAPAVAFLYI
jgi:hypothetical protein